MTSSQHLLGIYPHITEEEAGDIDVKWLLKHTEQEEESGFKSKLSDLSCILQLLLFRSADHVTPVSGAQSPGLLIPAQRSFLPWKQTDMLPSVHSYVWKENKE